MYRNRQVRGTGLSLESTALTLLGMRKKNKKTANKYAVMKKKTYLLYKSPLTPKACKGESERNEESSGVTCNISNCQK